MLQALPEEIRKILFGDNVDVGKLRWRRWAALQGAEYAEYEAPEYDPFATWGLEVGQYGYLMRSLAPIYAASIFRQLEAIPQYGGLAEIYRQQANYFAARTGYHTVLGDYAKIPADVFRVYRSFAHAAYYDYRATLGVPVGLASSIFKLASFSFPPGGVAGAVGLGWRAYGWPFLGAAQQIGAAGTMAPYVRQMYQMFPEYTESLITGVPTGEAPTGLKSYLAGFLQPYAYPTQEEAFGGGVGAWTGAQLTAWSAIAGIEAALTGQPVLRAITQTIRGTMSVGLIQAGLGLTIPATTTMIARSVTGMPMFFTPEEQQRAGIQIGAGLAMQVAGAAWQSFVAPRVSAIGAGAISGWTMPRLLPGLSEFRAYQSLGFGRISSAQMRDFVGAYFDQPGTRFGYTWLGKTGGRAFWMESPGISGTVKGFENIAAYQQEALGFPAGIVGRGVSGMMWRPSILARTISTIGGVVGAYGLSEILGRAGEEVSPEWGTVGQVGGAVAGYVGVSSWVSSILRAAGLGKWAAIPAGFGAMGLLSLGPQILLMAAIEAATIQVESEVMTRLVFGVPVTEPLMYRTGGGPVGVHERVWANPRLTNQQRLTQVEQLIKRYAEAYRSFMTTPWTEYYGYGGKMGPYVGSRWRPAPVEGVEPRRWPTEVVSYGGVSYVTNVWSRMYQYPGMVEPVYAGSRFPKEPAWWPMETIWTKGPAGFGGIVVPAWSSEYQYPGMVEPVYVGTRGYDPGMWPTEVAWYGKTGYTRNITWSKYQYPGMTEPAVYGSRWISPWTGVAPSVTGRGFWIAPGQYAFWSGSQLVTYNPGVPYTWKYYNTDDLKGWAPASFGETFASQPKAAIEYLTAKFGGNITKMYEKLYGYYGKDPTGKIFAGGNQSTGGYYGWDSRYQNITWIDWEEDTSSSQIAPSPITTVNRILARRSSKTVLPGFPEQGVPFGGLTTKVSGGVVSISPKASTEILQTTQDQPDSPADPGRTSTNWPGWWKSGVDPRAMWATQEMWLPAVEDMLDRFDDEWILDQVLYLMRGEGAEVLSEYLYENWSEEG